MHRHISKLGRRGVAAAEFAAIFGIALVLLVAVFNVGLWAWERLQLQSALAAGAVYAQSFPTDEAGIKDIIIASLPALGPGDVTVALSCECGGPSGCADQCAADGGKQVYVTISASRAFTPVGFISAAFLPELQKATAIAAERVVRVQ